MAARRWAPPPGPGEGCTAAGAALLIPLRLCSAGKCRGLRTARKLRSHRRDQKWHDKQYKKAHLGTALKANPFGGASHAKGIVLEKVWVELRRRPAGGVGGRPRCAWRRPVRGLGRAAALESQPEDEALERDLQKEARLSCFVF